MDILTLINSNLVVILGVLGILAFAVELIVQVTKELPGIKKLPTRFYVLIVSIVLCQLALFGYFAWAAVAIVWYYVVLAFFMAFVVAYISIFGWETLKELYDRYTKLKLGKKDV